MCVCVLVPCLLRQYITLGFSKKCLFLCRNDIQYLLACDLSEIRSCRIQRWIVAVSKVSGRHFLVKGICSCFQVELYDFDFTLVILEWALYIMYFCHLPFVGRDMYLYMTDSKEHSCQMYTLFSNSGFSELIVLLSEAIRIWPRSHQEDEDITLN